MLYDLHCLGRKPETRSADQPAMNWTTPSKLRPVSKSYRVSRQARQPGGQTKEHLLPGCLQTEIQCTDNLVEFALFGLHSTAAVRPFLEKGASPRSEKKRMREVKVICSHQATVGDVSPASCAFLSKAARSYTTLQTILNLS